MKVNWIFLSCLDRRRFSGHEMAHGSKLGMGLCSVFAKTGIKTSCPAESTDQSGTGIAKNQQNAVLGFQMLGPKDIGYAKNKLNRDELYLELNVDIPFQQVGRTLKRW